MGKNEGRFEGNAGKDRMGKHGGRRKKLITLLSLLLSVVLTLSSCGVSTGRTIMEYRGSKMGEKLYSYWLSTYKRNILSYSGTSDTEEFWSSPCTETQSYAEYFTEMLNKQIEYYLIGQYLFDYYNLKLDKDVISAINDDINEKIEYYGSRAELNEALGEFGMNIELLKTVYTWEEKHSAVYNHLFGDGGIAATTEEQINEYYEKNYSQIQYIVIYLAELVYDENGKLSYDTNGNVVIKELTESELAEKNALVEEVYAKAEAGEDFLSLMAEYSEYDTLSLYPDGFFVSANEVDTYGPYIVSAAQNAEVGDIVLVEEDSAVFIIKKMPLTELGKLSDTDITQLSSLEGYVRRELYENMFSELAKELSIDEDVMREYNIVTITPNPSSNF